MMTDPIAEMLARIRNGLMVKHAKVKVKSSKMTKELSKILKKTGYIVDSAEDNSEKFESLVLTMKYTEAGDPVIDGLRRISKPGLRIYSSSEELPRVRGGLGIAIVSTSRGVMTCSEARKIGIGGEIICHIW